MPYTYDPKTGKWKKTTTSTKDKPSSKPSDNKSSKKSTSKPKVTSPSKPNKSGNLTHNSTDSKSSKGKVEKENNYIEINTLEGTLNYIATPETIKITAGDTIKLNGLGINLSGNYYVKSVTRQFSASGYINSAVLIKTDMGTSLKETTKNGGKDRPTTTVSSTPSKKVRYYTVKKGDTLKKIAKKFYNSSSKKYVDKIYKANKKLIKYNKATSKYIIKVGQKIIIP